MRTPFADHPRKAFCLAERWEHTGSGPRMSKRAFFTLKA
jgi:hypothetical protein